MVTVDHSVCLSLAGSFGPAYVLTITALPQEIQANANKTNTAHLQSFLADILNVAPERGIVRFEAVPEENLGFNGSTIQGALERVRKAQIKDHRHSNITTESNRPVSRSSISSRTSFSALRKPAQPRPAPLSIPESRNSSRSSISLMSAVNESSESNTTMSPITPVTITSAQPDLYDLSSPPHDIFTQSPNPSLFFKSLQRSNSFGVQEARVVPPSDLRAATFTASSIRPPRLTENGDPILATAILKGPPAIPPEIKRKRSQTVSKRQSFMSMFRR